MLVYALLDRKMKEFGQLVCARNDEVVRRSVFDNLKGSNSQVEKFAGDFDLYHVGSFDQDVGVLIGSSPRLVATVADVLEASNGSGQATER